MKWKKSTRNKWGPLRVHRMNWKVRFRELTGWRPKNDERRTTVENLCEITHGNVTEAPRLGFSSRKQFSTLILSDYEVPEGLNPFLLHSSLYLLENRGGACHPARPGEPGCFLQKQPPSGGTSWKAQVGLVSICTPFFTKYTPFPFFVILFP